MIFSILLVFFKTAYYSLRILRQNEKGRLQVKKDWAQMILKSFGFSLTVQGTPPSKKPSVIVGNHISFMDIPVIMSVFPEITFIAKDDLKKWPIIGFAARAAGTIFVNRQSTSERHLVRQHVAQVLIQENKSVAIFPSGTTTLYEEKPWKKGAFEIAQAGSIPVQLFRIDYNPLRDSAYIDDDSLIGTMLKLMKIKNKKVSLKWLKQYESFDQPEIFCEVLRQEVVSNS